MFYFPATPALGFETGQAKPKGVELEVKARIYTILDDDCIAMAGAMIAGANLVFDVEMSGTLGSWRRGKSPQAIDKLRVWCLECHRPLVGPYPGCHPSPNDNIDPR